MVIQTCKSIEKLQNAIPFSRYSRFLPTGNWYRCRTSLEILYVWKKKFRQIRSLRHLKLRPKWAVAKRLIEQRQKFYCQFSTEMWWTNAENFKTISRFPFERMQKNWLHCSDLAPVTGTFAQSNQHMGLSQKTKLDLLQWFLVIKISSRTFRVCSSRRWSENKQFKW